MSAVDYVMFLSALDRGEIIPRSLVETMKRDRLGFDGAYAGLAGGYVWKDGQCHAFDAPRSASARRSE